MATNLYPFIKQAHFNSKLKPNLKLFLNSSKSSSKASPLTTTTHKIHNSETREHKHFQQEKPVETKIEMALLDIDCDIIESSQPEIVIKPMKSSFSGGSSSETATEYNKNTLNKLPNNHDDIVHIINMIDNKTEDMESAVCSTSSLISEFDSCCKRMKTKASCKENECNSSIQLNSDTTVAKISKPDERVSAFKTKITDYFIKLDKPK